MGLNTVVPFDLAYRERPPREPTIDKPPCLVLLHGYGSNELDLLGLSDSLDPRLHVVSVRAPIALGPQEFAWFELDWQPSRLIPDQEQALEARARLIELLRRLPELTGSAEKLLVAGFSQGAMMTLGVAIDAPELVRRVAMMSGAVLPKFLPQETDRRLEGVPALVQHGIHDTVLPPEGSRQAAQLLESLGARVRHVEYPMGHEVGYESLQDLREFLVPGS